MLRGERVRLRALESADAATIAPWYADHEFSVLDGNIYATSEPSLEAFIRTLISPSFTDASFGIENEGGVLIGIIRLKRGHAEDRRADLGIAIAKPWWSQGYGTDAILTLLRFAFDEMHLHRVSLGVLDDNLRAQRCYEKCGFVVEGRERQSKYRAGWHDNILMSILEDEFRAQPRS